MFVDLTTLQIIFGSDDDDDIGIYNFNCYINHHFFLLYKSPFFPHQGSWRDALCEVLQTVSVQTCIDQEALQKQFSKSEEHP